MWLSAGEFVGSTQTFGFVQDPSMSELFGCKYTEKLNDGIQRADWSPGDEVPVRRGTERAVGLRWLWTCSEYLTPNPLDR